MTFLKRFGLVKDDGDVKPPKKQPLAEQPKLTPVATTYVPMSDIDPSDDKIIEDALAACDLPGPDFLEFYNALESTKDIPIAELQRYQMAFNSLKTMKLTKEIIISTSASYVKELDNQAAQFGQARDSSFKVKVTDKRDKANQLMQKNIELQQEIQNNIQELNTLNGEAALDEQKINMRTQSFGAAVEKAKQKIANIITNVNNYLT